MAAMVFYTNRLLRVARKTFLRILSRWHIFFLAVIMIAFLNSQDAFRQWVNSSEQKVAPVCLIGTWLRVCWPPSIMCGAVRLLEISRTAANLFLVIFYIQGVISESGRRPLPPIIGAQYVHPPAEEPVASASSQDFAEQQATIGRPFIAVASAPAFSVAECGFAHLSDLLVVG